MSNPSGTDDSKAAEPTTAPFPAQVTEATPAPVAPAALSQTAPAFKLVKVRKPDGSIVTVRRKLNPEEVAAAGAPTAAKAATTSDPSGETFKIVTVRQPDGTLVKVKRAVKNQGPETPAAAPREASNQGSAQDTTTKPLNTKSSEPEAEKEVKEAVALDSKSASATTDPNKVTVPATRNVETERSAPVTAENAPPAADQAAIQEALDEQKDFFRQRKRHQFKTRLLRGVAAIAGSAVPAIEIGDHFMDGDEIVSDDDWSVDEDDDHDYQDDDHDGQDDHDHMSDAADDIHHGEEDAHPHAADDDDRTLGHQSTGQSAGHITIDAGAAVQGAAMAAATASSQPAQRQPLPSAAAAAPTPATGDKAAATEREKVTYKITAKVLNQMEDKTTEKASRPLQKHWANMTFYIMASLSIVLPLLFLLLGLFIILMNGKSVTSHWGSLQDVIKVAISAWPIVFAAVTAQVFKAWATYKVERGIKLMELEQLIGSNSFGSAIKQPFLLRRLDLLTLLLLVVWCLSPLGSQALQRTYTIDHALVNATMPVLYLDMTGPNRFFSLQYLAQNMHANNHYDIMQKMTNLYLATFLPETSYYDPYEDYWNHPRPIWLDSHKAIHAPGATSYYGIPLILTKSVFSDDYIPTDAPSEGNLRYERVTFPVTASYFDFQCGDWSVVNGSYFNDTTAIPEGLQWQNSLSGTAHYLFYSDNATAESDPMTMHFDRMRFASVITKGYTGNVGADALPITGDESLHSLIECNFEQKFVDFPVECYTDSSRQAGTADCQYLSGNAGGWDARETPTGSLKNTSGAQLFSGFDQTFAQNTSPFHVDGDQVATPNEIFLGLYDKEDTFDKYEFNLTSLASPEEFSRRISYLFNTWVDLGNSVHYLTYVKASDVQPGEEGDFVTVNATHVYTAGEVYYISVGWVVGYFLCAGALLIAGTLGVIVESMTVAPDVLGYVSTVARNSKYLQLPKTNSAMSGGERARVLGGTKVMMQDVKAKADVGRIALGLKHEKAEPLKPGRLYR